MTGIIRDISERKTLEAQRAAEQEQVAFLTTAMEHANDAVVVYHYDRRKDPPFVVSYVNAMFERQTGYARHETVGKGPALLHGPLTDRELVSRVTRSLLDLQALTVDILRYRKDGSTFWAEVTMTPLVNDRNELLGGISIQRDISERIALQGRLDLLSSAVDQANDMIAIFELQGERQQWRMVYVNEAAQRLTGYTETELLGQTSEFLTGPETDDQLLEEIRAVLADGKPSRGELAYYRKDGSRFWVEQNTRPLLDPRGAVTHTIGIYHDVTDKHYAEQQLSYEAAHDVLTLTFNRRYFDRALQEALDDAQRTGTSHALLFLDLDRFKPVNDVHGHDAGDMLLRELAANIRNKLREADVFARLGGDEFAILLNRCSREHAKKIAELLLKTVTEFRLSWEGHDIHVGVSIGVCEIRPSTTSAKEALRQADAACYAAKKSGRNRVSLFTPAS